MFGTLLEKQQMINDLSKLLQIVHLSIDLLTNLKLQTDA